MMSHPSGDLLQHLLHVGGVVAYHDAGDSRITVVIIELDLSHRDVEFLVESRHQRLQRAPLILERVAGWQVEIDRERTNMHAISVFKL